MTNRRTLFAIACLGLLTFGIVFTTLGAVLPEVTERFGLGKTAAGSLLTLSTFGVVVGSLVFGPIVDRWGYKEMLVFGTAIVIAGLEGIAFAPTLLWLRLSVVVSGFGGGIINGGTNALVADISTEGRTAGLSRLAVYFGFGAVGVPLTLGTLLGSFSYATILAAIGAAALIPLAATAVTPFPAPKQAQGFPLATARSLLRDPVLLTFGLMLFLESGMEVTVGGWTTTFFKEELGTPARQALVYLALFWLGMMLARTTLGILLRRFAPTRILFGCITIGVAGALLVVATHSAPMAACGVFLLGVGFSGTFPLVLGFVADRYARLSGTAFSVVMVMALLGGMTLPYVAGVVGASYGLRLSFLIVPAALVVLAVLLSLVSSRSSRAPADGLTIATPD